MKSLRLLLVLLSPMLFFACSKEKSFEAGSGTTINSQWEFTEGSRLFKGPVDTAFLTRISNVNSLIVEGTSDDGTGLLTIAVIGINTSSPGVYKSPAVVFDYSNNQGSIYQNDITAVDQFTVEITKIDSAGVTGTFSGQAKDTNGVLKPITSGKFSAKFGASVIPPGTAQMTFWSKSSCSAGGNINVTLTNSQTGSISSFTATAPACGAAGTASFNVPPGTYGWLAKCGTDSTAGVITLAANQCVKQEVVLGSATPTGEATFWAKSSCTAGGNITVKLSNNQTGTITSFNATAPASCTAAGNANFNLPAGSYTWVAKCGTDSITGNLNLVASQCAKVEVQFPTGTAAQYALVSAGGNCSNIQVNGTYIAGKPLGPDTNTVVVQVNVTTIGSYTISTNNVNGYSFSASGSFTTTGVQNVTLKGAGTPTAA
ncbi:MAG TPA: hypothetical protein VGD17_08695, partial [Chitinophagaceae bacterium]